MNLARVVHVGWSTRRQQALLYRTDLCSEAKALAAALPIAQSVATCPPTLDCNDVHHAAVLVTENK